MPTEPSPPPPSTHAPQQTHPQHPQHPHAHQQQHVPPSSSIFSTRAGPRYNTLFRVMNPELFIARREKVPIAAWIGTACFALTAAYVAYSQLSFVAQQSDPVATAASAAATSSIAEAEAKRERLARIRAQLEQEEREVAAAAAAARNASPQQQSR